MKIVERTFEEVSAYESKMHYKGLVFLGCGDPSEWLEGVPEVLVETGIISGPEVFEEEVIQTVSTGGRTDLTFLFSSEGTVSMGKLAMWRLKWGDCSWLSDWVVNYASQYGVEDLEELDE